jgi:Protein of unknown function (DUF1488)
MKSTAASVFVHLVTVVPARASTTEGGNQKTGVRGLRAITRHTKANSMQIIFPNETPEYSGRELTLAFPAMVDGERVECMITAEALEDHYGAASPRLEDMVGAFAEHRARIEAATRRLLSETRAQCLVLRSGYVRFYEANWRN